MKIERSQRVDHDLQFMIAARRGRVGSSRIRGRVALTEHLG